MAADADTWHLAPNTWHLERLAQFVEPLLLTVPPNVPPRSVGDLAEYVRLAGKLRKLGRLDIAALVKIFTQSAVESVDEWFENEQLKVTLATAGANGGVWRRHVPRRRLRLT